MLKTLFYNSRKFFFGGILSFITFCLILLNQSCTPDAKSEADNGDINGMILYRYDSSGSYFIDSFKAIDYTPSVSSDSIIPDTIKIRANRSFVFKVKLVKVNESTRALTDVTNEIWVLRDQHNLVFFPTTTVANLSISYLDIDSRGYPVGFTTRWKATNTASILVLADLRHLPTAKTPDPNVNLDLGSSDFNIRFPTIIQ
ncbi:MAG: hypothetical protein ORN85_05205 [Sediminibacterium sp.]|nr:hypothetical protein [Sediminibacterium sp.]